MGRFIKGDVVVVPFPFSDLSSTKRRPALVVAPLTGVDVILCMITTHNRADGYAIPLTQADFDNGNLPYNSIIRPNRLFTADSQLIYRQAGQLKSEKITEVIEKIIEIIS